MDPISLFGDLMGWLSTEPMPHILIGLSAIIALFQIWGSFYLERDSSADSLAAAIGIVVGIFDSMVASWAFSEGETGLFVIFMLMIFSLVFSIYRLKDFPWPVVLALITALVITIYAYNAASNFSLPFDPTVIYLVAFVIFFLVSYTVFRIICSLFALASSVVNLMPLKATIAIVGILECIAYFLFDTSVSGFIRSFL